MITAGRLTPPGTGAIAVVAVRGAGAYALLRTLFFPANRKRLPETLANGFRFGNFGDESGDEIILAVKSAEECEIHSHGGSRVVDWIMARLAASGVTKTVTQFMSPAGATPPGPPLAGGEEIRPILPHEPLPAAGFFSPPLPRGGRGGSLPTLEMNQPLALLPFAKTVRCASILLDQANGAYDRSLQDLTPEVRETLRRNAGVGRHLIDPWKVVIAGRPNAGKSSLLNALAGYARSVVSAIPGTTRDTVSAELAFDGWPVTVTDTAGLRETADALEGEGVRRAKERLRTADFVIWLIDMEYDVQEQVDAIPEDVRERMILTVNKMDLYPAAERHGLGVSALTGAGVPDLIATIISRLVPTPPNPGEPVPYTPALADYWMTQSASH